MKRLLYAAATLALSMPVVTFALGIEASIGGWRQDPGGYLSYKGDTLDVDQNLRYGKKDRVFARLKIDMPSIIPNLYFMASPTKFSGEGQKDVNFRFGDRTFTANIPFYSEVKLDHYDLALYYGVPGINTLTKGIFNVELGLNARIFDFSAKLEQQQTGISESKSAKVPIPMVYTGVQIKPVKFLKVEGEFRGIAYGSNRYYDAIGRLKVKPYGPVFVSGGYRYQELKIDYQDIRSKIKLNGPFLEAGLEF